MAKIKVNGDGKVQYEVSRALNFSLVSSPANGRKQVIAFQTCRDYVNDSIISFINHKVSTNGYWSPGKNAEIDLETLRILFTHSAGGEINEETLRKRMYSAKRIINMYENLTNWRERSVLSRVDHSCERIKCCWLMTGPGEWMKATHLVSMITLIFRVVISNGGFSKLENLDQVEKRFKELCTPGSSLWTDLGDYLPKSYKKFRMLMGYYDRLFGNFTHEQCNPPEYVHYWHDGGGIRSFCTFSTRVPRIDDNTKSAWRSWNNKTKNKKA